VQLYGAAGRLDSDIEYSDWQPLGAAPTGAPRAETSELRSRHHIWRPQDDYKLEIQILKLTVNEEISADRLSWPSRREPSCTSGRRAGGSAAVIWQLIANNVMRRPIRTV